MCSMYSSADEAFTSSWTSTDTVLAKEIVPRKIQYKSCTTSCHVRNTQGFKGLRGLRGGAEGQKKIYDDKRAAIT